jgi:hypothetical protein
MALGRKKIGSKELNTKKTAGNLTSGGAAGSKKKDGSKKKVSKKLGSKKTFLCDACGYNADRDIGAARSILLRNMSLVTLNHTAQSLQERGWCCHPH